jgi:hypothetical protein
MLFASVHLSSSSSLYSVVCFFLWQYLCMRRQRLCTKSKTLPSRGLPRARCPHALNVFRNFSKIPTTLSRQIARARSFLTKTRTQRKAKMTICVRWRVAYSFKAPSANAPADTTRRLASNSLVSGFHLIHFREHSSDRTDSGPK